MSSNPPSPHCQDTTETYSATAIGNHHLEYGFPSTHSTNSVSIALFLYDLLQRVYHPEGAMTQLTYQLAVVVLAFYVFSIVYGRLYTGMHSFTDCVFGAALGAGLWGLHILCGQAVDTWSRENGFIGACTPSPHSMLMRPAHPLRGLSARGDRAALPVPGAPAPAAGGRLPVLRGCDRVRVRRDG